MSNATEELLALYSELTKDCLINQIDSTFVYYYADKNNMNVYVNNIENKIYEVDIKSAFPTVCRMLYGEDHWFVKNIDNISDKFERNKYIATTLTHDSSPDLIYKIRDLNTWAKIIILGFCYSQFIDPFIFELKKDGILFSANGKVSNYTSQQSQFLELIQLYSFEFHLKEYRHYARINKTSYYYDKELKIKGQFRTLPLYIKDFITSIFEYKIDLFDSKLTEVKKVYSQLYFDICVKQGLYTKLKKLYVFDDLYVINAAGKLVKLNSIYDIRSIVVPYLYLRLIIFPIISLMRSA